MLQPLVLIFLLLWRLLAEVVHLAARLSGKALVALACIAVYLLTLFVDSLGILGVLIIKDVLLGHVEVEVLLLAGTVILHEVHALMGLFSPGMEVESEITVAQVPKLKSRGKVEANCDADGQ